LGAGAKIAHKTGDIGTLVADVGSIESPSGKNYLAAVLVKRRHNDPAGPELIRQMSKIVYDYFEPATSTQLFVPK
jgi:beta-lactamase class A